MNQPPEILLFAGRLHPLLVHLPIGMIVLLATLELAAQTRKFKNANASAGFIIAIAAPLAVISAVCGWLLSLGGGYDAQLLQWHKWFGIGTATACVITAIFFWRGKFFAYRASLFLTVLLLAIAGHLGGSLTHGSGYLTEYAPSVVKKILGVPGAKKVLPNGNAVANAAQLPVFANVILPVLQKNCVSCHGAEKSKGGLRLDSFAALMKGGKNGVALQPGDAAHSLLWQRVKLPATDDDHMPPDGKIQPSADDLALMQWWIDAGAPETKTVGELQPEGEVQKILRARFDMSAALP